jgi:succinylglutamic semialdehyde dehydrogenase
MAVLGPFNLPAHLPHSHIIPALIAGNAVVFKPSESAPATAEVLAKAWDAAGLPPGVFSLLQGQGDTGKALADQGGIDGLLFTGGVKTGLALARVFSEKPDKILALELGGNNPLLIWDPENIEAAAEIIIASTFLTAGQRCVCARKVILPQREVGDACLNALIEKAKSLVIGRYQANPAPYYGPVIHDAAANSVLAAQRRLRLAGAKPLLVSTPAKDCSRLLSPGIWEVTRESALPDEEVFGPLLQVWRVNDFASGLALARATRFGLSAGLVSQDPELWEKFREGIRAGIVNWNRPLTGASGKLPFGGVGLSGNHRPSAFHAADYCAYPMASVESPPTGLSSLTSDR